jgi:hypothetical protein
MTVLATGDTHPYLSFQTQAWVGELLRLGVDNTFVNVAYVGHSWAALDVHATCDWFDPIRASVPIEGNQLVDEDGQRVQHITVQQDQSGVFTPFQWYADANANRLSLWNHMSADSTDDELLLTNLPYGPALVTRDGQPASFVYDAQLGTCLLVNPGGAAHLWQIRF